MPSRAMLPVVLIGAALLLLCGSTPARAHDPEPESRTAADLWIEYIVDGPLVRPSGDALYDAYALLLAQNFIDTMDTSYQRLRRFPPEMYGYQTELSPLPGGPLNLQPDGSRDNLRVLPEEQLDVLEPQFGADPRYWELRWWNARLRADSLSRPESDAWRATAVEWLRRGAARGASDFAGGWLIFEEDRQLRRRAISEQIESMAAATPLERAQAFEQQYVEELAGLNALIQRDSDLSFLYYERSQLRMEWGDYEGGLEDLAAGNAARFNELPLPFPLAPVYFHLSAEATGRAELDWVAWGWEHPDLTAVVEGLILSGRPSDNLSSVLKTKERVKELELRLKVGASPAEIRVWRDYVCRFGTMGGSSPTQWQVAEVMHMLLAGMLLEHSDGLSGVQARQLLALDRRSRSIGQRIKDSASEDGPTLRAAIDSALGSNQLGSFELAGALLQNQLPALASNAYGFRTGYYGPDPLVGPAMIETSGAAPAVVTAAYFNWVRERGRDEFQLLFPEVRKVFSELAAFDLDTFSWPEELQQQF